MKALLAIALVAAPLGTWLLSPLPTGLDGPPPPTAQVSSGPTGSGSLPFPDGNAPGFTWGIKASTNIGTATLTEVSFPGGTLAPSNFMGGLNGDVGTVMIKSTALKAGVTTYTATFEVNGSNPPIKIKVTLQNPHARAGVVVDFGGLEFYGESGFFPVSVLDAQGSVVSTYHGEASLTMFSLRGSRARVDGIGPQAPILIEAGEGEIFIEVLERIAGDTLILEITAPRLDTTRSSVNL